MELKVFSNKKGKALYYMRSVRKKGRKNPTKEKVEFLGYKADLKKLYEDPIPSIVRPHLNHSHPPCG